jgi:transcriptional regulator with PAS, ATPase and Fis domain
LQKATAWDADERFTDAGEFCRALDEALRSKEMAGNAPHVSHSSQPLQVSTIREALERHDGNHSRAAKELGVSRAMLLRFLRKNSDNLT